MSILLFRNKRHHTRKHQQTVFTDLNSDKSGSYRMLRDSQLRLAIVFAQQTNLSRVFNHDLIMLAHYDK